MPAPHPEDLLDRYLAGELSGAEAERVRAYFDADPGRRATLAAAHAILRGDAYGAPPDVTAAHADLLARIAAAERVGTAARPPAKQPVRPLAWHQLRGLGAAAVGLIGLLALWATGHMLRETRPVERHYATRAGQQATVVFPDGSQATLAPATTLHVVSDAHDTRVTIDGEALFVVDHRAGHAFRVTAHGLVARVLGTTFAVRRYASDSQARLVVTSGRVALSSAASGSNARVFAAGEVGIVTDSGVIQGVSDVSAADYLAWSSGRLVFHKSPAREIVAELGRMYGIELRLTDSTLARQSISWSVSTHTMSLTAALDEFDALLEAHAVRDGNVITIVPGRRASASSAPRRTFHSQETFYGR